ncbi:MAG: hypothetical protein IPF88_14195 [Candidatus Microthrix sp.]|nr:hypothetical protein [Candidatus Microthrix sp.]
MRVLEVFGGQSAEHDVSVASGWAVAGGLREAGHHVTAAHIDRGGRWRAIELDGQLRRSRSRSVARCRPLGAVDPATHGQTCSWRCCTVPEARTG